MANNVDLTKGGEDWHAILMALLAEREGSLGIRASMATIEAEDL